MAEALTPVEVFCCYAHADEAWLRKLETHLSLLQRQGLISLWYDRLISPGSDWAKTIDTRLETASVILLLVSADFLASDYCYSIEMKRALERQEAGEARVVPILVRSVNWNDAPFAHLQVLPTDTTPLSTWLDEDTALADITAGIRRVIVEELQQISASVPCAALPTIWNIPYPRNPFFLGRDDELTRLHHHLQKGQATALSQPQAISGLGGIGKTQLALEYTYRYHQDYQAVLWVRAESKEALISSYVAIASLLRLPEREVKEQEVIVQAIKTWLQTHCGWLFILDNADELALLPDFLPPALGGHLLLTTRAAATGRLAHRMEIATLLPEQGALFLLRRAGLIAPDAILEQASSLELELALRVSQELGGLPLALDQAGAYLEETGTDLAGYLYLYQQYRSELLRERRGLIADHPAPVATTWSLSFERVKKKNPAAAELLCLCAFLSPDAIPEEILTAGAPHLGPVLASVAAEALLLDQAIEALRVYSLVQRDPKEKSLSVHRLVQAVLHDTLEETQRRSWAERVIRAVSAAFPQGGYRTWVQRDRLLPQMLAAAHSIEQYQLLIEEAGRLLYVLASYLRHRARYAEAEPLYQRALHIREQHLGPDHPQVADPLDELAMLYVDWGRYAEAEPLYQRALRIWEQQLGYSYPEVAYPLLGLANLYRKQGKYAEAEPLYQRALRIREQQFGYEHPEIAEVLHNLALLRETRGNSKEAKSLYTRALVVQEQTLGPHHPKTTETRTRLIALLHVLGQQEEAAQLEAAQPEP